MSSPESKPDDIAIDPQNFLRVGIIATTASVITEGFIVDTTNLTTDYAIDLAIGGAAVVGIGLVCSGLNRLVHWLRDR